MEKNERYNPVNKTKSVPLWKLLIVIITPIILLPLPLVSKARESNCAYVIMLMTIYWMTEAVPLAATALLPISLYPLLGVQNASDTAASYFKDTNFLIFGSLLMAVAVEVTGLHYRIALRILLWFGAKPQWLILGFMITAGFLSMWISNTATCAMMIPIVIVVVEEIIRQHRHIHQMGQLGPSNEPSTPESSTSVFDDKLSPEELGFCRAACIGVSYASSAGGVGALTGTTSNLILVGQLHQFYPNQKAISFANWFAFGLPMQFLLIIIGWIWLLVLFMGGRAGLLCFRRRTEADSAISKLLRLEYEKLGPIRFPEAVVATLFTIVIVLWVTQDPGFITGWSSFFKEGFVSDSTPVMFASFILFAFPAALGPLAWWKRNRVSTVSPDQRVSKSCCSFRKYQPIIDWSYMQEKFPWSVIILMGGGFALADGVKSSLFHIAPQATILLILVLMTAVSEFASNSATASVFIPILLTVADGLKINPLYFGISVAVGSGFGFMLPVGTPPNMIVFEKGKQLGILGPWEMIKAGIGLDLICIVIAFITMHTTGYWVYGFNTYPDWAVSASSNYSACNRTGT